MHTRGEDTQPAQSIFMAYIHRFPWECAPDKVGIWAQSLPLSLPLSLPNPLSFKRRDPHAQCAPPQTHGPFQNHIHSLPEGTLCTDRVGNPPCTHSLPGKILRTDRVGPPPHAIGVQPKSPHTINVQPTPPGYGQSHPTPSANNVIPGGVPGTAGETDSLRSLLPERLGSPRVGATDSDHPQAQSCALWTAGPGRQAG